MIDTGLRRAAENIALDQAILSAHDQGSAPDTLRFLRFLPSALIGFHQSVEQELRLGYCREHGIEVQRRITGGGAIYFDEAQIGWELYLDRRTLAGARADEITRLICEAAAAGISRLGVNARYRPRNDIEVEGRKISGTGGVGEGHSLLYQGTLLLDLDVERMVAVLRIPAEKLRDKAVQSARERVVTLKELLGRLPPMAEVRDALADAFRSALGIGFAPGALSAAEEALYREALSVIDSDEWVFENRHPRSEAPIREGLHRGLGGIVRAAVLLDERRALLRQVWFTGDFFIEPKRVVRDLEAELKDVPLESVEGLIEAFFHDRRVTSVLLGPADFVAAIQAAVASGESE